MADVERLLSSFMIRPSKGAVPRASLRFRRLLDVVGSPQDSLTAIHVAGTSGKTSICYYLRSLLWLAGWTPGLTVSPHVVAVNDRIQIGDGPVEADDMLQNLGIFLGQLPRDVRNTITYLDLMMAFAWWMFARAKVDCAVVEVGVGGLHDRTNFLAATGKVCVIGDIGLDHVGVLGHSLAEIAVHKAGIIKRGCHVVALEQHPVAMSVISSAAATRDATVEYVDGAGSAPAGLPAFQRRNWALATAAYRHMASVHRLPKLSPGTLASVALDQPPGRMERWQLGGRELVLDGAHNPQKMGALRRHLTSSSRARRNIVANMVQSTGGRIADTCAELAQFGDHVIVPSFQSTPVPVKRSVSATEFANIALSKGVPSAEPVEDTEEALCRALDASAPVVVTGSLYLVSQARNVLMRWGASLATRDRSPVHSAVSGDRIRSTPVLR
ncbi:bifunctional folylpolyglutamate synthase/dihydrofolate synthase [Phytohabitans rumicis]|uniref:bifunctional folylpolyglutamate synthase/dihydrofolate synthase n=1 Tax=Phytohabitans rumicis TaxID=1076125 RepID=UPI0015666EBE|nr:Mur ligase family protein [Phytohabitans rumicis]